MAFQVGALQARLGFLVDDEGAVRFDRKLKTLRGETAKPITAELKGDLNPHDLNLYDKKLNELRAKVAKRDAFKAQLGAHFDPRAFNAYERESRRVQRATEDNVKATGKLHTAFGNVYGRGGSLFAAAGGLYGAYAGLKSVITASGEAEVSQKKLQTQLKASGVSYDAHAKQIDQVIQKTSQLSGLDDEDLQDAFTNIVRVTGKVNESLKLTGLAADFARARHMGVAKAGELLGKVAGGNVGVLSRYGLAIKPVTTAVDALAKSHGKATVEQQRAAKESDKQATAQAGLAALQQKFSGQAEAYGKTQTGSLERVSVAWENLREKLGEKLAPTITKVANAIAKFVSEMADGTGQGGRFVETLKDIWEQLKRVLNIGADVGGWLKDHMGLVKLAATAWVGYKVAALGAAAASKAAGLAALLAARRAGGGAAAGAAGAAAGAGTGRLARFAGAAGGASGVIVAAGGIKAISDAIHGASASDLGLLDQYAKRIAALAKAGDAGGMRKLAAQLRETAKANADTTKGDHLKAFATALDLTAKSGGKDLSALQAAFRAMAKSSGGDLEKVRGDMLKTKQSAGFNFDAVRKETNEVRRQFRLMMINTDGSMAEIQDVVHRNTLRIKQDLGGRSKEGKEALASNFRQAARAVRTQMRNGEISTKEGMQAIRGYLVQELRVYGLSLSQARNVVKGGNKGRQYGDTDQNLGREGGASDVMGQRGMRFQSGGWLGRRGMVGPDTIPVSPGYWAAPGEYFAKGPGGHGAVINRHQAPLVDLALMAGGHTLDSLPRDSSALPRIEAAMAPLGGLDSLFAAITRPHMLQGGGSIIPVPGFPGESAAARVIPAIEAIAHRFGLVLTDAFGQGHKSPGHTRFGTAADFAGSDAAMDAAVRYLVGQGYLVGYDGRFGSQNWPGHGPSTVAGGNAHLHVELGGKGGVLAPVAQIPGIRIRGGGAVGRAVQGALGLARGAAQSMLQGATNSMLSTPVGGGGNGAAGGAANKSIARRMLGAFGFGAGQFPALDRLWTGESGWNANAVNPSSGAGGIPQALPASKMGPGWQGNAAQQIRWGLGYIKSRYGSPAAAYAAWLSRSPHWYARGGRFLQGGGRSGPNTASGVGDTSHPGQAGGSPYSIGALRHRQGDRVKAYDDVLDSIEGDRKHYEQVDRRYGQSDEELIDANGNIDQTALRRRLDELGGLKAIRERIKRRLEEARRIARRIVKTYGEIIRRLRNSLQHAKKKDRAGIREQIKTYRGRREEWRGNVKQLGSDIIDARLDVGDIRKEIRAVAGTQAEPTGGDGGGDTGDTGDAGGLGITADQQAGLDQVAELKAIVARGDYANAAAVRTLSVFAPNFNPNTIGQQGVGRPEVTPAGATRWPGGSGSFQEAQTGAQHITNVTFNSPLKPSPQEAMAVAGIVNAGNSYRGSVSSPRVNLGV